MTAPPLALPAARRVPLAVELPALAAVGALQTLAYVHTVLWGLPLVAIALLAWRMAHATPRRAALLGLAYGTAWLAAGTWWMFVSLHRYGGLPAWLAALAVALLCVFLSLYLAVAMAAFARWRSGRAARDALLFGAWWLLAELARGVLFTGFPWVASGYAQVDGPLAALAPWMGVYGIGFVAAVLAAWAAFSLSAGRRALQGLVWAVAILALLALLGPGTFTRPAGTLQVTLLQTNVPQDEKFSLERIPQTLRRAAELLTAAQGDLVVAPETVIPLLPAQLDAAYWQALLAHFQRPGGPAALIGLPLGDPQAGYTNSAAGISAATRGLPGGYYRYDKHHLVPFGEFIPPGFRWFTEMMNIPLGDFNRGAAAAPSFGVDGERVAPNICYEDLFGEELAARFADPARAPTVFANLSNIAWFGDTIAIPQHLQISRLRALEFQRPMLRATNTGATAIIDHQGEVTAALEPYTDGALQGPVQGRTGLTPYAWWAARADLWPLALLAAALALGLAHRSRP